jgi:hypothetical protein
MAIVIKNKRAVKAFRKSLGSRVRNGTAALRVFGSKGEWYLGVQIGRTIHRYSVSLITQTTAVLAGHREFGIKAAQYKSRVAA